MNPKDVLANIRTPTVPIGEWAIEGACRSRPLDWFYGRHTAHKNPIERTKIANAKAICSTCIVSQECLDYALEAEEPDGIWGGLDLQERKEHLLLRERAS